MVKTPSSAPQASEQGAAAAHAPNKFLQHSKHYLQRLGISGKVMAVLVIFGIAGSVTLLASHADTTQVPCTSIGSGKYNCTFYETSPVVNSTNQQIGTIHAGVNWIKCQQTGAEAYVGGYHNNWWAWTQVDGTSGQYGWVNAVYGSGGINDGGYSTAPLCNASITTSKPPQPVAQAPGSAGSTSQPVAYTGYNDGCGSNATHYDRGVHVSQSDTGGSCTCNSGKSVPYGPAINDSVSNSKCTSVVATTTSTPTSGSSSKPTAYNGNNDGCGSNATHYDQGVHVSRSDTGGSCTCNSGKSVPYGPAIDDSVQNTKCGQASTANGCPAGTHSANGDCINNSTAIVAYNGNNDGCGSNATHYNGSTHVGQSNYGSGSYCRCNNGVVQPYSGPVPQTSCVGNSVSCPSDTHLTNGACLNNSSAVVAYSGYADGCGSNATHYDSTGTIHVGQSNYGGGSKCVCDNGVVQSYTGPVSQTSCATASSLCGAGEHERDGECVNNYTPPPSGTVLDKRLSQYGY